ncbi:MAG TPA: MG2 domain-containing protein [Acidobacteriota bacterium]|nr:MG2 domain-containing protein [Acidobacteriota bacterium]HNT18430.1 MG2 domain-containing protein [Acidobacteriota bacterium]
MGRIRVLTVSLFLSVCVIAAFAGDLEVLSANPQGELQNLERDRFESIQILFSESMVNTLETPDEANRLPSYITITPTTGWRAYWGSDRLLKIVPGEKEKVPYSTRFVVTVKKGASSISGSVLGQDYSFSFTTPTLKIISAAMMRNREDLDSPAVIAVLFNQPVDPQGIARHLAITTREKQLSSNVLTPEGFREMDRREPGARDRLYAKLERVYDEVKNRRQLVFRVAEKRTEQVDSFVKSHFGWYMRNSGDSNIMVVETVSAPPLHADLVLKFDSQTKALEGGVSPKNGIEYPLTGFSALFLVDHYGGRPKPTFTVDGHPTIDFSKAVDYKELYRNLKGYDMTEGTEIELKEPEGTQTSYLSLGMLGFKPEAGHHYLFRVDENMKSVDGEQLGYPAYASFEFTLSRAYVSFGEGEGVWESARGTMVPFYARNVVTVEQKMAPVPVEELVPILNSGYSGEGEMLSLVNTGKMVKETREIKGFRQDKVFNAGLELKPFLNAGGKGIVWASIALKQAYKDAPVSSHWYDGSKTALIQVTDLGLTLKYSPEECLVHVTSLSSARPVAGCQVEIRSMDNRVIAAAVTDERGIAAIDKAPFSVPEGEYASYYNRLFAVIARKDGDTAYIVNDWADGMEPWRFDIPYSWNLGVTRKKAGIIFTDRGVYKLGEEVHYKAILRNKVKGVFALFDPGSSVVIELTDPKGKVRESRTVTLSSMSSSDGVFSIPKEAALGRYEIAISFGEEQRIYGSFLVAAYRKPDFRVSVDISGKQGETSLEGKLSASYLFGAPLSAGDVKYHFQGRPSYSLPEEVTEVFPGENWNYRLCWWDERKMKDRDTVQEGEAKLDADGELKMSFPITPQPVPMEYSVETEVTDVTRQSISSSGTTVLYPDHFIGLFEGEWAFRDYKEGIKTRMVVLSSDGKAVPGIDVEVELSKMVWRSSNSATGDSYYEWESNWDFEIVETRKVRSAEAPVDLAFQVPSGGEYIVRAKADIGGMTREVSSSWWFYGGGYTPWERRTDNKIEVMVEKPKYKPGDTARIFIKSPWETGRILLTTERETVRSCRTLDLTSTQQMVEIKLTEDDIPNIYVSVILLKGRSGEDENDKPAFRIGYAKISVENETKNLRVSVSSDREEYRPADKAKVKATVRDIAGAPVQGAEVTLWAVDVGVLNLTNYKTPDPSKSFWVERPLSVFNADSREKLISARVSIPKGEDEGGGGGMEYGQASQIRKDFRVLAFWVGSAMTGADGSFEGEFLLPESLTAFRIMAVAHDRLSRFGSGEKEFIVSQKLLLTPAFPRFLTAGDEAYAGVLLNSRLSKGGTGKVNIESLTPALLSVEASEKSAEIAAKGKSEFRWKMKGLLPGTARVRVRASLLDENDAFELDIPVNYPLEKVTKVQAGEFSGEVLLEGEVPGDIFTTIGGLEVTVSQNLMAEIKDGFNFVIEYPYGCAEQRSSRIIVLLNSYALGRLLGKTGDKGEKAKKVIIDGIKGLGPFQRSDGGFGLWVGDGVSQPYLSAYICHLLQRAKEEGLLPDEEMLTECVNYLEGLMTKDRKITPEYYYCWYEESSFAAKVIAEGGRNSDQILNLMLEKVASVPTISLCHLWDAAVKSGKASAARTLENAVRSRLVMSGQKGYLKENRDTYYYYYWASDEIATAAALKSFITNTNDTDMQFRLAKFLVERGRVQDEWNTHRNAMIYEALAAYAKKQAEMSARCPVTVTLNGKTLFDAVLGDKNGPELTRAVPMEELAKSVRGKFALKLASGTGDKLHYSVRLRYAPRGVMLSPLVRGIAVKRTYTASGSKEEKTSFTAGEMVEVHLEVTVPDKSYNVVVTDPLPAGFEILDGAFATTAKKLKSMKPNDSRGEDEDYYGYYEWEYYDWWWISGFRQIEKHDDRVVMFADYLSPGKHQFTYLARATTSGEFQAASPSAEEMYDAGVNGRGQGVLVKVSDGQGRK